MARSEKEGVPESQLVEALFMLLFAHFVSETSKTLSLQQNKYITSCWRNPEDHSTWQQQAESSIQGCKYALSAQIHTTTRVFLQPSVFFLGTTDEKMEAQSCSDRSDVVVSKLSG